MTTSASIATPELTGLTISSAVAALQSGTISARQLVESFLARADSAAYLNAFVTLDREGALQAADAVDAARAAGEPLGPLAGIPLVVKDNIHVGGMPATAGCPGLADFIPAEDAPVVRQLRDAGAILMGKTQMHELAFGATGYNPSFNTGERVGVRNPYNPEHISGGSSSGSAVAMGAHLALAALGTDTGGSMRIPCALCGCPSIRPSSGRYPRGGMIPISSSRDTAGPMGLCMEDVALLDALVTEQSELPEIALSQLRLGVSSEFWRNLDGDTQTLADAALEKLKAAGVTLVPIEDSQIQALNQPIGFPVVFYEAYHALVAYLRDEGPGISIEQLVERVGSPDVKAVYEQIVLPQQLPTDDGPVDLAPIYQAAMESGKPALQAHYKELFARYAIDALIFPTTAIVAPKAYPEVSQPGNFDLLIQNTEPAASAGLPGIQLPIGLGPDSGLPVGMELDAPAGSDRRLLAIGIALEACFGRLPAATLAEAQ